MITQKPNETSLNNIKKKNYFLNTNDETIKLAL